MKPRLQIFLNETLFLTIFWMVSLNLINAMVMSMSPFHDFSVLPIENAHEIIMEYNSTLAGKLEATIFGFFLGVFFAVIHYFTEGKILHRLSFGKFLIVKSLLYLVGMSFAMFSILLIYKLAGAYPEEIAIKIKDLGLLLPMFFTFGIYVLANIILSNFILQVDKKFGPGNLWKMLLGKYHTPKDEYRIFMFLDLKGSTTIAERLGHNLYSQLIQNCFHDLAEMVVRYKGEIYQYVGDEAVITWTLNNGLQNFNCIRLYYDFEKKLASRKKFYLKRFGEFPIFKAGIELGPVTVAEVGDLKKEIAYHGDVLNTAARIQSMCNGFGEKLLVSEHVEEKLRDATGIRLELMGDLQLRGKKQFVKVFAVKNDGLFPQKLTKKTDKHQLPTEV